MRCDRHDGELDAAVAPVVHPRATSRETITERARKKPKRHAVGHLRRAQWFDTTPQLSQVVLALLKAVELGGSSVVAERRFVTCHVYRVRDGQHEDDGL